MPGNIVIGWDETQPAGSESVGLGDDRIRSTKSNVRGALDSEHFFPSSGGSAGAHRLGSARAFYDTQSRVSSADTSGRLMVTSDTSRLWSVSSVAATPGHQVLLGAGPLTPSFGSFIQPGLAASTITFPVQHRWIAMEIGQEASDGAGRFVVTFPNGGFVNTPYVFLGSGASNFAGAAYVANLHAVTASGFSAHIHKLDGSAIASEVSLLWWAIGDRSFDGG